jgi:arsenite methyltransferase
MLQAQTKPLSGIATESLDDLYFDFQANIGMTKHIGSTKATDELLELCQINDRSVVLDVGCGVGFTSSYIAEKYGIRVVGVDIRPHMIERARQYAKDAELDSFIGYEVADGQDLPMSDNVFDAVICESVLAFIPDQKKALQEWIRVAKPGAYIGFTEAVWITQPPEEDRLKMDGMTGAGGGVQPSEKWETLIHDVGLDNVVCRHYPLNIVADARGQIKQMRVSRLLKAWTKTAKLMLTQKKYRSFAGQANQIPKSLMKHIGYGIYVGQVPK